MKFQFLKKTVLYLPAAIFIFLISSCNTAPANQGPDITVNIDPSLGTQEAEPNELTEGSAESSLVESDTNAIEAVAEPLAPASSNAYPDPESGYPGPSAITETGSSEAPNPDRNIELLNNESGSVGGVLVRELPNNGGYQPIKPIDLYLAEMLLDSNGDPIFIGKTDGSPSANLFDTGVFIFQGIKPDTYGLIIDLGFSQFPITDENGDIRLVEVVPGEALDLGQLFVALPN